MNADELRAAQAPLKARYREQPEAAMVTGHTLVVDGGFSISG